MVHDILTALRQLPAEAIVVIIAALPVVELRGAIPVALGLGLTPAAAFGLSILGNLLPVPVVLWALQPLRRLLAHRGPVRRFFAWVDRRALARRQLLDRYGPLGLVLFVGVPLPLTGAWTGAILAVLLDLPRLRSLLAIAAGVLAAGLLIGTLSTLGWLALR